MKNFLSSTSLQILKGNIFIILRYLVSWFHIIKCYIYYTIIYCKISYHFQLSILYYYRPIYYIINFWSWQFILSKQCTVILKNNTKIYFCKKIFIYYEIIRKNIHKNNVSKYEHYVQYSSSIYLHDCSYLGVQ